jgi:hypothetical protein
MDNFEWAYGYERRFGIVHVDYDTMTRTVKDSGHWYRRLATTGELPPTDEVGSDEVSSDTAGSDTAGADTVGSHEVGSDEVGKETPGGDAPGLAPAIGNGAAVA